ncbi:cytidine deaminase-like protein [Pelagophyceae sp. CCMP2097]|nr:cytidine deaminase-like protein [Pelagophyceae sp. CCMP2097]
MGMLLLLVALSGSFYEEAGALASRGRAWPARAPTHGPRRCAPRRLRLAASAAVGPPAATDASVAAAAASDAAMMREAIELALRGRGKTFPNPIVGCVIVASDGCTVLGSGFHPAAGEPHAEIFAMRDAGAVFGLAESGAGGWSVDNVAALAGATAYVTLEPCSHHGRTPPCCDALVAARVGRVVIGIEDPAPWVSGNGIARLRASGVRVDVGVEAEACAAMNAEWIANVTASASAKANATVSAKANGTSSIKVNATAAAEACCEPGA